MRCSVRRTVLSRKFTEVWVCWWLNLIVGWNELMCRRKFVRAEEPWVHSMNMSWMKRSHVGGCGGN